MTKEEIMALDVEALETRYAEIKNAVETNAEGADFEALSAELDAIKDRKAQIAEETRKADIIAVINETNTTETTITQPQEERHMADIKEIRASGEYAEAYKKYILTNDDKECRALLTEMVSGDVPVPAIVDGTIATAWANNKILSRVKRTFVKGILRQGFELSATDAVIHEEGDEAITEEELHLGIVELKPASIKKYITISDEVIDMTGEEFLRYIYDELTYRIAKLAEDTLIGLIDAAPAASTASAVGVPVIKAALSLDLVAQAISRLSDRAANPVIIMNKLSYSAFKAVQYANGYPVDPFEGLEVLFNDTIKAIGSASENDTYLIVGDLGVGAQANFPKGDEITIKYDDLSLAEADLVKIVGREYVALGLVAPGAFVKVTAPGA
jgi:HK97 family phage major capsid protein